MFSNLYTLYCRKLFAAATNFNRFVVYCCILISFVLLLAQITPLADVYHWIFFCNFIITLHSSIAATSASQYKKKLKLNKMLSIFVMFCNFMPCNFDCPSFSCPSFSAPRGNTRVAVTIRKPLRKIVIRHTADSTNEWMQGYYFSGISGYLEMPGNSAEVREKSGKGQGIYVVREIWLWQLNKITYPYVIRTVNCNSFFIRDVDGDFVLINVHLFTILLAISSRKVRDFFLLGAW